MDLAAIFIVINALNSILIKFNPIIPQLRHLNNMINSTNSILPHFLPIPKQIRHTAHPPTNLNILRKHQHLQPLPRINLHILTPKLLPNSHPKKLNLTNTGSDSKFCLHHTK